MIPNWEITLLLQSPSKAAVPRNLYYHLVHRSVMYPAALLIVSVARCWEMTSAWCGSPNPLANITTVPRRAPFDRLSLNSVELGSNPRAPSSPSGQYHYQQVQQILAAMPSFAIFSSRTLTASPPRFSLPTNLAGRLSKHAGLASKAAVEY